MALRLQPQFKRALGLEVADHLGELEPTDSAEARAYDRFKAREVGHSHTLCVHVGRSTGMAVLESSTTY